MPGRGPFPDQVEDRLMPGRIPFYFYETMSNSEDIKEKHTFIYVNQRGRFNLD
jgi:hypothetical protein